MSEESQDSPMMINPRADATTSTPINNINNAISTSTLVAFTIAFMVLYALLFALVYVQLFLVLYYRYKRLSYQTVLLFLCLFWAALRTVLFSIFVQNVTNATIKPYTPAHWVLYSAPVCLQYTILCLLVLYFAQVVLKAKVRYEPDQYRCYKWRLRIVVLSFVFLFICVNILSAIIIAHEMYVERVVQARVVINGLLFTLSSTVLSVCIWKIWRMTSANVLLEARGISVCQASTACIVIVLVFASRAIYNILAVSQQVGCPKFGFTWQYVSDEADLIEVLKDFRFIIFGIVLFIWEFLPTLVVVLFFRVRCSSGNSTEVKGQGNFYHRAYFFDDPRRYDSDEDLTRPTLTSAIPRDHNQDIPSLGSTPLNASGQCGYGTLVRSSSYTSGHNIPGTTPPMLFSSNVSLGGYQPHQSNGVFD